MRPEGNVDGGREASGDERIGSDAELASPVPKWEVGDMRFSGRVNYSMGFSSGGE
jgi:hypothetical protein